jgi:poly-gamma-glutamate synthesis protein (capsule biosynthesis protein)
MSPDARTPSPASPEVTLFLCGDVMTGRGVDQILPHPGDPRLHEPYVHLASTYVELAEAAGGPIARPVGFDYVWGDAAAEWARVKPDVRIANLESAVTTSEDWDPAKGIHYRMHPDNTPVLSAAGLDCCVLANNHTLDWGAVGLAETLEALHEAGIATAGAGSSVGEAARPATIDVAGKGRVLVFAWASEDSGVPRAWAAAAGRPGVNFLPDLSAQRIESIAAEVRPLKRAGDVVVASIHWGANWGYAVSEEERAFAHALIDGAGVDLVHGHSSHHAKAIEVYRDRPILYGCGDFLNDYEGISGHEKYRPGLALMYFATFDCSSGELKRFVLSPLEIRRLRLARASLQDARWLASVLTREGRAFATRARLAPDGTLFLEWRSRALV